MHAWDLATTLGVELEVPDDLVIDVEVFAHRVLDGWERDGVNFAVSVEAPAASAPLERLVAYTGREVPAG